MALPTSLTASTTSLSGKFAANDPHREVHNKTNFFVSNTYFHDHYKASLVGQSDSNGDEDSGINSRMGAQALVESNVFVGIKDALTSQFSKEDGYAVAEDNDFGDSENSAPKGTLTSVPYEYELLGSENVKAAVVGVAGNTLTLA
jgi:pectate lyase